MDVRTLIFGLGLLNLTLAAVVFVYRFTKQKQDPQLRLWQYAKLVGGVGYVLGWSRALLPPDWMLWVHVGNIMQVAGMGMEFVVYAQFLGANAWVPRIKALMAVTLPMFVFVIAWPASRQPMILFGTGLAGVLYLGMAMLYGRYAYQSPLLLKLMGAMNAVLALVLLAKVLSGLTFYTLVPYQNNFMNILLYAVGFWVMCVNGFGFLLLEQQQSDRALNQAMTLLEQSEASERALLRMAAHEFRTPAAMIKASVDSLALIDKDLPPDVVRRHNNIRMAVQRMTDLAGLLITRDRLKGAAIAPQHQLLSLNALTTEASRLYPPEPPITLQLAAASAQISGDPTLLRIALQNLIDNALASTPDGQSVHIATATDQGWCRISVQDRGPGVPAERRAELLTGRFSASGSLSKGVGLSIVKAIADAHGGQVELTDNTPSGSVFSLTLPLQFSPQLTQA